MEEAIILKYPISGEDFTRAGEASSDVKRKLKQMGGESGGHPEGGHRHV